MTSPCAKLIINKIESLDFENKFSDPLIEPTIIGGAIRKGILDAPHLRNIAVAKGDIITGFINGACVALDKDGNILKESERLKKL